MRIIQLPINDHDRAVIEGISQLTGIAFSDLIGQILSHAVSAQSLADIQQVQQTVAEATKLKVSPVGPLVVGDDAFDLYLSGRKAYLTTDLSQVHVFDTLVISNANVQNQQFLLRVISDIQENPQTKISTLSLWTPKEYAVVASNPDNDFLKLNFPDGVLSQEDLKNIRFTETEEPK